MISGFCRQRYFVDLKNMQTKHGRQRETDRGRDRERERHALNFRLNSPTSRMNAILHSPNNMILSLGAAKQTECTAAPVLSLIRGKLFHAHSAHFLSVLHQACVCPHALLTLTRRRYYRGC